MLNDFTQYTLDTWLAEGSFWKQIERDLVKKTIDIALLEPFKSCVGRKGIEWGIFLPQVILKRATEAKQPIGFIADALIIVGTIINEKKTIKETKYFWLAEPAQQLYDAEIHQMEKKNKWNQENMANNKIAGKIIQQKYKYTLSEMLQIIIEQGGTEHEKRETLKKLMAEAL